MACRSHSCIDFVVITKFLKETEDFQGLLAQAVYDGYIEATKEGSNILNGLFDKFKLKYPLLEDSLPHANGLQSLNLFRNKLHRVSNFSGNMSYFVPQCLN